MTVKTEVVKPTDAKPEVPAEAKPAAPTTCLVRMLRPARYSVRGVLYEAGKTYEVRAAQRDYLVGMRMTLPYGDEERVLTDVVGKPLAFFEDYSPPKSIEQQELDDFTPMTPEGAALLAKRPARDDGFRTAQAVHVDDQGQIDTGYAPRRARDPDHASRLLRHSGRPVPV